MSQAIAGIGMAQAVLRSLCTSLGRGGTWSYPLHPYTDSGDDLRKVFYRVTGDDVLGTFLGTFVSVNGVDRNKKDGKQFRVFQPSSSFNPFPFAQNEITQLS